MLLIDDEDKVGHLLKLEGAKERLHIFKADLMEEGSFDSAISGCQGVFHTASPVDFNVIDPQVHVIPPLCIKRSTRIKKWVSLR